MIRFLNPNICYIFAVLLVLVGASRQKRDNAAFTENFGGPVAQSSANETKSNTSKNSNQKEEQLEPCEIAQNKKVPKTRLDPPTKLDGKLPFGEAASRLEKLKKEFEQFRKRFNKPAPAASDFDRILKVFSKNKEKIFNLATQRRSVSDASIDLTQFADEDFDSFKNTRTGLLPVDSKDALKIDPKTLKLGNNAKCQKVDWNSTSVMPPVRDQNQCGACYAVASSDLLTMQRAIEAKIAYNDKDRVSAQYFVDCVPEPYAYKCNGGRPFKILQSLQKCSSSCQLPTDSCYPYLAKNGTKCLASTLCSTRTSVKVSDVQMLDISGPGEKEAMAALLRWGPVIAIVGVSESWQFYNGTGVIRAHQCSEEQSHAVLITGYDYSSCVPTYTVRNSWGNKWGAGGYIKLEAGKNTCAIAKTVVSINSQKASKDVKEYFENIGKNPNYAACKTKFLVL